VYPIHPGCHEPFLLHAEMRGVERAFDDLALRPRLVDPALGRPSQAALFCRGGLTTKMMMAARIRRPAEHL